MNVIASEPSSRHLPESGLAEILGGSPLAPLWWRAERVGAPSAWWQHVPFAHWLVPAIGPRCLVELGTHAGVSYAAFCHAAACTGLQARCYAVDTWHGDPHAGEYGEDVFTELRAYHDQHFAGFSTLLRMTFDEALEVFADGSIDLLHIDGLHTYDAVRHDFDNWRPKLSPHGVVLFHDTAEHHGDFGVWRLWSELKAEYPSFEFHHGHGLGVLAVGPDVPEAVARLCSAGESAAAAARALFCRLGERWEIETQLRMSAAALERQSGEADRQAKAAKAHFDAIQAELQRVAAAAAAEHAQQEERARAGEAALAAAAQAEERASALAQRLRDAEAELAAAENLHSRLADAQHATRAAAARAARAEVRHATASESAARGWAAAQEASDQLQALQENLANSERRAHLAQRDGEAAQQQLLAVLNSTTWRASGPLRAAAGWMPRGVRRSARRSLGTVLRMARRRPEAAVLERPAAAPAMQVPAPATPAEADAPAMIAHSVRPIAADARVVWISGEPHTPGHAYRVERPAAAAASVGIEVIVVTLDEVADRLRDIEQASVLVIWRAAWDGRVALALDTAARAGVPILFDVDDLMFDPARARTELIDGIRSLGMSEDFVRDFYARMQATMGRASLCLASTEELAIQMRKTGKPALVLQNGFAHQDWQRARLAARRRAAGPGDGLLRIGYAGGTRTHQRDFAACAGAAAAVLRAHPDCRLVLFRDRDTGRGLVDVEEFPALAAMQEQIEWRDTVPLASLPDEIARFDVNLVPLETGNIYVEAKSELKFFEAAMAGVVTVASPTGPLRRAIVPGRTGFLAESAAEWEAHLTALLADPAARRRAADAARLAVLWPFGPEKRAQDVASIIDLKASPRAAAAAFAARISRASRTPSEPAIPDHEILFESDRLLSADVTVMVPLYNYEHTVCEALDSAFAQDAPALDLVVVEDRSTDGSLETVLAWAEAHKGRFNRVVVARHRRNEGLGAARNSGFALSDTPWVMALDADNRLRPACVRTCLQAAMAAGAALAYPMLQMFGDRTDRLGEREWDPAFLACGNYIDAMALVSRAAWAGVGGYDTTRTGWEDYGLWCSFAAAGLWGVRVPGEALAEYRVHGTSMISVAMQERDKVQWIMQHSRSRHPWLTLVDHTEEARTGKGGAEEGRA